MNLNILLRTKLNFGDSFGNSQGLSGPNKGTKGTWLQLIRKLHPSLVMVFQISKDRSQIGPKWEPEERETGGGDKSWLIFKLLNTSKVTKFTYLMSSLGLW